MDKLLEPIRAGHFRQALSDLKQSWSEWNAQPVTRDVILAELLQRTGDFAEAMRIAQRCGSVRGVSPELQARCEIVIGSVLRDRGDTTAAIDHLRKAIAIATTAKLREQLCWAELRLFLALSEGPGLDSAVALVPSLRRDVSRLGDPLTSSALHLFVARIETKRGSLSNAQEHVRIGRSLLSLQQNSWLESTAAIDAACLAYLFSDLETARAEALSALSEANLHGHMGVRRAGLANLGHFELASGRFGTAEKCLLKALSLAGSTGENREGIVDGLVQVAISRHSLGEAQTLLCSQAEWSPDAPQGTWYYRLWGTLTRGRFLLMIGDVAGAVRCLCGAAEGVDQVGDSTLSNSLRLLYAEALARDGRHAVAAEIVGQVAGGCDAAPIEAIAEVARATARAQEAQPDGGVGAMAFERAARIFEAVGNRTARAELLDAYADAVARRAGAAAAPAPEPGRLEALPRPPRRVTFRLDRCSALAPPAVPTAARAAARAAAVMESGAYPEVLGHEVVALLRETECVSSAALAARRAGGPPEILAWWGCSWPEALALAGAPPRRLDLGAWQGRTFTLAVRPPADMEALATLLAVEKLARTARWQEKARRDERERAALWPIEPGSDATDALFLNEEMTGIVASARKVAPTTVPVLLTGETGTGKEVLARIIHAASPRADRPFVPFNCTAVPREMIDSQLFGYRRGAFTGAVADFPGVIRAAAGGTLFLDEIGEVALDVQPKLLRFLESGEIQPLGDSRPRPSMDVRVVAATNANLDELVSAGRFRSDLFYRLDGVRLRVPPLRERREEVPPLAQHFLQKAAREFKKGALSLSEETMEYLVLYKWPGNVRQLANEMRRMAALAESGAVLMPEHLDAQIAASRRTIPASERQLAATELVVRLDQPLPAAIEHVERAMVQHALGQCAGRLEDAARLLGLSRKGLYLKRQRLGLAADNAAE
jgi:DNA-binding NtrC family response regulator